MGPPMPLTIGSLFGGRLFRSSTRPRRRAPFELETLESRLLLAGAVPSSPSSWEPSRPPAQVSPSESVVPVTLHLPEGDSTWPAIAAPPGTGECVGSLRPG